MERTPLTKTQIDQSTKSHQIGPPSNLRAGKGFAQGGFQQGVKGGKGYSNGGFAKGGFAKVPHLEG